MLRTQNKRAKVSPTKKTSVHPKQPLKLAKRRNQTLRQRTANGKNHFDAVVIGAGMGGIAAALGVVTPALSQPSDGSSLSPPTRRHRVLVIEKENDFCFHSTGRTAAIYSEVYGSPSVRALSIASKPFYYTPTKTGLLKASEDATDNDLMSRRGSIWVATKKSQKDLEELYEASKPLVPSLRMISLDEMKKMAPPTAYPATTTKMDYDEELAELYGKDDGDYTPTLACLEADAADMDVNAIWAAMMKVATQHGAELVNNVELSKAQYDPTKKWSLSLRNTLADKSTDDVEISADFVINASGPWADQVNAILGARTHDIKPKQRTVIQFLPDEYVHQADQTTNPLDTFNEWPSVCDVHDRYYYKPDAGRILASPCDEIDAKAGDVQPDELTVAITVERLKQSSFFDPVNIIHKWAGLRSFAPDHEFVLGFDGGNPGSKFTTKSESNFGKDLIHVTGLGGYGIQSAMGTAVCISGLVHNGQFPQHILDMGLEPSAVCPARF